MSDFDNYHTPVWGSKGRGWGLLKVPKTLQFSGPGVQSDAHVVMDSNTSDSDPLVCEGLSTSYESDASRGQQGVFSSTPYPNSQPPNIITEMTEIINQVGQQIADSIVTRLSPTHKVDAHSVDNSSKNV